MPKERAIKRTLLAVTVIMVSLVSFCYALETTTHEAINVHIAENTLNGFSLKSYLKDQLGIQKGIEESFDSKTVLQWLSEGGKKEDIPYSWMPYLRSVNHFHNPLTDQGYSGIWGHDILFGQSSVNWSQMSIGTQYPGGYYSWYDVRDYFYKSLTLTNKTDRETNFAETFRGLGQLMHLVEDMSVPEHTRDDGHGPCSLSYNYECWVQAHVDRAISQYTPFYFFDSSAIGNPNPLAPVPIANLFDTNQYNNGTSPDITLRSDIGLSEYTNANFLSPDSMFTAAFPYPNWGSVVEHDETVAGKKRTYLRKLGQGETESGQVGNGEHVEHLAVGRWGYKLLPSLLKQTGIYLKMDEQVYSEYAQKLIPRAVGYSAGLLNYFFRGNIDAVPDDVTGHGGFIVNNTEEYMNGTFELYYDNTNGERIGIWSGSFALDSLSSGNNKSSNITFPAPTDAAERCTYILIFRGQMGNEQDAVVGKVLE